MKLSSRLYILGIFLISLSATALEKSVYQIGSNNADGANGSPVSIALMNGDILSLKTKLQPGMTLLFEDLLPGANWSHPVKYKVAGTDGKVLEEVAAKFPPVDFKSALLLSGPETRGDGAVQFKLNSYEGLLRVPTPSRYYAILINGQADQRHWNDMSFLYRVLVQIYGYSPQNILVADSSFKSSGADLDGDGKADINYESTVQGVKEMMLIARGMVTANDHLILAINDHGDVQGGESTIVLKDKQMKVSEFAPLLNAIKAQSVVSIYEQCYSGGFVRPTVGQSRVAMSAATNAEYSWASMDLNFDEFIYHVISAFAKQRHDGTPVNADLNADSYISAQEAFAYASGRDRRPESPLLESYNNSAHSFELGISSKGIK